jgi:hypothetical protein
MKAQVEHDLAQLAQERKEIEGRQKEINHEIGSRQKLLAHLNACLEQQKDGIVPARREDASTAAMFQFRKSLVKPARGLIKNVRAVMHGVGRQRLSPPDVRDILVECGYPDSKNLLSEIHAAVRRLVKRGEIAPVRFPTGPQIVGYRSRGLRGMKMRNSAQ